MALELCAPIRAGEIVVFDKAYVDIEYLHHLHQRGMTLVTRSKENLCFGVMGQQLNEEEIQQAQHMLEAKIFVEQQPCILSDLCIQLSTYLLFRLFAWLGGWKRSFRRF